MSATKKYRIFNINGGYGVSESDDLERLVGLVQESGSPERYRIEKRVEEPRWKAL